MGLVGILLGALVAVTYGTADFLGGFSSRRLPVPCVLVGSQLVGLLVLVGLVLVTGVGHVTSSDVVHGVAAGVVGLVALAMFFQAFVQGSMAVVAPIAAVGTAVVPFVWAVAVGGERPSGLAVAGVVLAVTGVVIVARPAPALSPVGVGAGPVGAPTSVAGAAEWPAPAVPSGQLTARPVPGPSGPLVPAAASPRARTRVVDLARAAGSGAAFGTVFILLSDAGHDARLVPLLVARLTSLPLAALWLTVHIVRTGWRPAVALRTRSTGGLLAAQGVFDTSANALFVAAAHTGLLSEVAVVSALYPAPTVVLASVVLHEPVGRAQRYGLVLVLAGVVLIAT
ncbi:MAG TPA: EamA family transporter [Acidimicrobiales bacterium]